MKEYYKISVSFTGLKRKDRKVKFHTLFLGHVEIIDEVALSDKVRSFLAENVKEVKSQVTINLDKIKEENGIMTWEPFSKDNVRFYLTSPLEQALS